MVKDSEIYSEYGLTKMLEKSKENKLACNGNPDIEINGGNLSDWESRILDLENSLKEKVNQTKI